MLHTRSVIVCCVSQEEMLTEDSAEAEGVVPTDDAEASQVRFPTVTKTHQTLSYQSKHSHYGTVNY